MASPSFSSGEEGPASCDLRVGVLQWSGSGESGDEWLGRIFEFEQGQARLQELVVRFRTPELTADEARWFGAEDLPTYATDALVASRTYLDEEWDTLCEAFRDAGFENSESLELTELVATGVPPIDLRTAWKRGETVVRIAKAGDVSRVRSSESEPIRMEIPSYMLQDEATLETSRALAFVAFVSRRVEAESESLEMSSGDVWQVSLVASRLRKWLMTSPDDRFPWLLGTQLETAAARGSDAVALALIGGSTDPGWLMVLGNHASPSAVFDLTRATRAAIDRQSVTEVGLGFRALLGVAPAVTRREAVHLLEAGAPMARPALGVFFFTEPELRTELNRVDLEDDEAVADAIDRVLRHLAGTAREGDVRSTARSMLGE